MVVRVACWLPGRLDGRVSFKAPMAKALSAISSSASSITSISLSSLLPDSWVWDWGSVGSDRLGSFISVSAGPVSIEAGKAAPHGPVPGDEEDPDVTSLGWDKERALEACPGRGRELEVGGTFVRSSAAPVILEAGEAAPDGIGREAEEEEERDSLRG